MNSLEDWHETTAYNQGLMGHEYSRPFAKEDGSFFLCSSYDPANINNNDEDNMTELDADRVEYATKSIINDTPVFKDKVEEAIWRIKRGDKT